MLPSRTWTCLAGLAGLAGLATTATFAPGRVAAPAAVSAAVPAAGPAAVRVVVQAQPGAGDAAARAVRRLGGRVDLSLPLVSGVAATVPAGAVAALASSAGIRAVTPDGAVRVAGGADPVPAGVEASGRGLSLSPQVLGAPTAWAAGVTGRGVTVAVLDTGISPSADLGGRVLRVRPAQLQPGGPATAACANLSGEPTCADGYGHGTFMAGLVAGSGGRSVGVAPGADLVSVKVAGRSGAADVSTILAGIQWVVSFHETYGIRVLNLSLGTDSLQSWQSDPLNYAVERAWAAGITVVVAASNNGPGAATVAKPGDDPWVLTVGSSDSRGSVGLRDDRVPDFSSRGPTREGVAKPDLVAPGGHVLSLVSPGSTLQAEFPSGPWPYRTGSGTSMSTALVSGTAALLLQAHPELPPDQVKFALVAAARPVATADRGQVGAGEVDAAAVLHPAAGSANGGLGRSSGLGGLQASRGSLQMQAGDTLLSGRETAQLLLWDPVGFATGDWTSTGWYTSVSALAGWNTSTWAGTPFSGHDWTGHDWTGASWQGHHDPAPSYGRYSSGSGSYGGWD